MPDPARLAAPYFFLAEKLTDFLLLGSLAIVT
jgi:hypothetical protein